MERAIMLRSPFRSWKIVLHLRYSSHDVKRIWFSPFKWLPFQMHLDVRFRSWLFEIQSSFFLTRELSPFGFLKVRQSRNDFFKPTKFSKKWTNEFDFTTMIPQVYLFSFVLWKKKQRHISKLTDLALCQE